MITIAPAVKYNIRDFRGRLDAMLVSFLIVSERPSILLFPLLMFTPLRGQRPVSHQELLIQYDDDTYAPNDNPTVSSSSICAHISAMTLACADSYVENTCVVASIQVLQKGQSLNH